MKILENQFDNFEVKRALRQLGFATNSRMTDEKVDFFTEKLISKGFMPKEIMLACDQFAFGEKFPSLGELFASCSRQTARKELDGCDWCSYSGFVHMEKMKEVIPGRPMKYETAFSCECEKGKSHTQHMSYVEGAKLGYTLCD
ncbi:hypothetical protein [Polynucleobacter sp.]|uniref:hypothetical protein n=1 Tax=Polynucleobacter sp. TaxID=2029855 RepID=UPI003F69FECC